MFKKIPKNLLKILKVVIVFILIAIGIIISFEKDKVNKNNFQNLEKLIITKIVDGDTVEAKIKNKKIKIRLYGVDTPETLKQNNKNKLAKYENYYANLAKEMLYQKILNQDHFYYKHIDNDEYGRDVGLIYKQNLDENIFSDTLNSFLVENGLARVAYIQNSNIKQKYYTKNKFQNDFYNYIIGLEEKTKVEEKGFWGLDLEEVFYKYKKMV
ncbi:thermonuclease family protein [Mycoplasma sp. CSL7503-lung]|uniref:thermonuclease family protein n=1 Tax=Mycoplasma sp. CSL7503-lung TaxID=536372 RepID=UPI0021CF79AB|nr:thermonuclease family protein [Mycoplasma sp. CSL7503-lung]MCU4706999.1 thermonuclease family protein [Mycoplasma sp. CSL7503-lung]